ncbi:MAG: T9SS type A sorting domain-containing protein, partial [Bacteroidia bacterium]|nr:T9SS type A sorting domain-containing protein [Bacteroidia bacterium]
SGYYFQWYLNGYPIYLAENPYYVITQPGTYMVNISDHTETGCSGTSAPFPVYTTGIAGTSNQEFKINIMPNPNNGQFRLYVDTEKKSPVVWELYDMLGKQVYSGQKVIAGSDIIEIDITRYPKGLYLLNVRNLQHSTTIRVVSQ